MGNEQESDVSKQAAGRAPMGWRETWTLYWGAPNSSSSRAVSLRV